MKSIIKTSIAKAFAVALFLSFSLPAHAGWLTQFTSCPDTDGGFITVKECDAWGGHCPDQFCGCGGEEQEM